MVEKEIQKMIRTLNQLGYVIFSPEEMGNMKEDYLTNDNIFLGEVIERYLQLDSR
jgi:hypothetical protein